jgi:hypothetical protein
MYVNITTIRTGNTMKTLYTTDKNFIKQIQKYLRKDEYVFIIYEGKKKYKSKRIDFVTVNMYIDDTDITTEVSLFNKYDYTGVTKIEIEKKPK